MLGKLLLISGGTLAVMISFGLTMWMVAQPPGDINRTHVFAMAATSSAGMLAVVTRGETRWGVVAMALLALGMVPLLVWLSLLFWPSLMMMVLGLTRELIRNKSGGTV